MTAATMECCEPIGRIERVEEPPPQHPRGRREVIRHGEDLMQRPAVIRVEEWACPGLQGLRPGTLIWVIWLAHLAPSGRKEPLTVRPFMDEDLPATGVFATRSPARPCPLGLSLAYVENVDYEECRLLVTGLDAYNGTPVLDIKPYTPGLDDPREAVRRHREAHLGKAGNGDS